MTATFDGLVDDVVSEVASWLLHPRDLKNLGLTVSSLDVYHSGWLNHENQSSRIWPLTAPFLYSNLELDQFSWEPCLITLRIRPDLAKHVRSLRLYNSIDTVSYGDAGLLHSGHTLLEGLDPSSADGQEHLFSLVLADRVAKMNNLEAFVWDLSWPMSSYLWDALALGECGNVMSLC
jgi:hypothetical protein